MNIPYFNTPHDRAIVILSAIGIVLLFTIPLFLVLLLVIFSWALA